MRLINIFLKNFRNYNNLSLDFPLNCAVFYGANGSGKTNILEAAYLLCTGRSHHGASRKEMIHFGEKVALLAGNFAVPNSGTHAVSEKREVSFDGDNSVLMKINDRQVTSFAEWFGTHPIVSFSPGDIQLVYGAPDLRRRFLDMFISSLDREYLLALMFYKKNLALRNRLLNISSDDILFDLYEEKMAEAGAIITEKRAIFIDKLNSVCERVYREISGTTEHCLLTYEPNFTNNSSSKNSWKNVFFTMLSGRRKNDRERGFSSIGPHRDDVRFLINDKAAKTYSSHGQCRSLVLSLKIASLLCHEKQTGENAIVLFDDAVSELDDGRAARVYSLIENKGQLFVASPQKRVPMKSDFACFHVADGTVAAG
jgi:DNA replication and repair protein RecF